MSRPQPLHSPGLGGSHAGNATPDVGLCPSASRQRSPVSRGDVVEETVEDVGRAVGSQVKNDRTPVYVAPGNQQQLGNGGREEMEVPSASPTPAGSVLASNCDPSDLGQREEFVTLRGVPLEPLVKVVPLGERVFAAPPLLRLGGEKVFY